MYRICNLTLAWTLNSIELLKQFYSFLAINATESFRYFEVDILTYWNTDMLPAGYPTLLTCRTPTGRCRRLWWEVRAGPSCCWSGPPRLYPRLCAANQPFKVNLKTESLYEGWWMESKSLFLQKQILRLETAVYVMYNYCLQKTFR